MVPHLQHSKQKLDFLNVCTVQKMIRSLCFLIFCTCIVFVSRAQSYYYYTYEAPVNDAPRVQYKAFLSLGMDGKATVRIQYKAGAENKLFLYELSLTDSIIPEAVDGKRFLISTDAPLPLLGEDSQGFILPRFIFKKITDSSGDYYQPTSVEVKTKQDDWVAVYRPEIIEKEYVDLGKDEPFVSSFYFESDAFYQYIFDDRTRSAVAPRREKLFLITVADTDDKTIGISTNVDLKNVNELISSIAKNLGIVNVLSIKISGSNYGKKAVEDAISLVSANRPGPSDIIIFYFSGHGFRLPGDVSAYPNLSFRTNANRKNKEVGDYMPLENIYKKLAGLQSKVCLVIGDCCNDDLYKNPVFGRDIIIGKKGGIGAFNEESAKKLFLPTLPISMLIGSVEKGHLSLGFPSTGGFFTQFLIAELQKNLWGYYSNNSFNLSFQSKAIWLRILLEARKNTFLKARAEQCGDTPNDRCIQRAEILILPK